MFCYLKSSHKVIKILYHFFDPSVPVVFWKVRHAQMSLEVAGLFKYEWPFKVYHALKGLSIYRRFLFLNSTVYVQGTLNNHLTLFTQCYFSYRNQSFDLLCKSNDWFQFGMQHWAEMVEWESTCLKLAAKALK